MSNPEPRSLCQIFRDVTREHAQDLAYRHKHAGKWVDVTWDEQRRTVERIAASLWALGVGTGDRVAILAATRLEWVQCDAAIVCLGAISVGIYHSSLGPDCAQILRHCEASLLFVEDEAQLEKIRASLAELPGLRTVVRFEGPGAGDGRVLGWQEFLDRGREVPASRLAERAEKIGPDDVAALVYTSGTTGVPKGAMITHGNLLFTTWAAGQCLSVQPGYSTLLFLPLAHVFARMVVYWCLREAMPIAFSASTVSIPSDLQEIRPSFLVGVPRIFERFHEKILFEAGSGDGARARLFRWAIDVGKRAARDRLAGRSPAPLLRARLLVADRLVLRRIRALFGGRLDWAASGAAPLNPEVAEFFHACGVPIVEGLGMTENASLTNVNRLAHNKLGTVGPVVPGVEMRLAEDGEILFRGPNVMKGYFRDPQATAEAIDGEGWLHTGDIGEIDADGFLRITDRKKDLIITAGGKNVAPQRIERMLCRSPFVRQALAFGDRRKFITALVALDTDQLRRWAAEQGLDTADAGKLVSDPLVRKKIQGEVDRTNAQLASYESVKKFEILPRELTVEEGDLTPTLKIRRKAVHQKYRELLDRMYGA